MKMLLLTFFILYFSEDSICQNKYTKKYYFGLYSVETGFCNEMTGIKVYNENKLFYSNCFGDGAGYDNVDTMKLNTDSIPDFIFSYQMGEYTWIGMLVSQIDKKYTYIDVLDVFDPYTYDSVIKQKKGEQLCSYVLMDVNNDGTKDIVTNIVLSQGKYISINNWTDTIYNVELVARAQGKITKPHSKGVLLSK